MSDPKHPLKVVITVEKGMLTGIWFDRNPGIEIKFMVADYDVNDSDAGEDALGNLRHLHEEVAWVDTAKVRQIINKKGAKKKEEE